MSESNKGQNRLDFDPRIRIAAALVEVFKSDPEGFVNEYEPCDDDGNPCGGTLLRIDSVLDPQSLADAVIRELGLRPERWKTDDPTMLRGHWTRYVTDWTHPDA